MAHPAVCPIQGRGHFLGLEVNEFGDGEREGRVRSLPTTDLRSEGAPVLTIGGTSPHQL